MSDLGILPVQPIVNGLGQFCYERQSLLGMLAVIHMIAGIVSVIKYKKMTRTLRPWSFCIITSGCGFGALNYWNLRREWRGLFHGITSNGEEKAASNEMHPKNTSVVSLKIDIFVSLLRRFKPTH